MYLKEKMNKNMPLLAMTYSIVFHQILVKSIKVYALLKLLNNRKMNCMNGQAF